MQQWSNGISGRFQGSFKGSAVLSQWPRFRVVRHFIRKVLRHCHVPVTRPGNAIDWLLTITGQLAFTPATKSRLLHPVIFCHGCVLCQKKNTTLSGIQGEKIAVVHF
jgi:hypothetical protein